MSELVNGFDVSIVDEKVSNVGPAGIDIAYQRLVTSLTSMMATTGQRAGRATLTSRARRLVIHGLADRMCDVSSGQATADAIPGAELILIEGMGHDLAPGLRSQLAERIAEFVWRAEGHEIRVPVATGVMPTGGSR